MAKDIKDGGPAFPMQYADDSFQTGITLRDYLAARAPEDVPGWFPVKLNANGQTNETMEMRYFRWRYAYADAMLKAREE